MQIDLMVGSTIIEIQPADFKFELWLLHSYQHLKHGVSVFECMLWTS